MSVLTAVNYKGEKMKLKDVIKLSAVYLGRENVVNYLENLKTEDDTVLYAVDTLTRCANITVSELASTFIPMIKKERVGTENGKIYYTELTETPLEIKNVYDSSGYKITFEINPEYVEVSGLEVFIEYVYLPTNYGISDSIGYTERQVPSRVIAYGVAAEFCLTERSFDESVMWRKRYTDALSLILAPKNKRIKQRRFI